MTKINRYGFVLLFFLAAGLFLRLWHLGDQSLWIDEGYTALASVQILEHGYPLMESGFVYTKGLLLSYTNAILIAIFGFDAFYPWVVRLIPAILGSALIIVTYWAARSILKDRMMALVAAAFITFSYWEIAWSRQARGYTGVSMMILIGLTLIYRYIDGQGNKYIYWGTAALLSGMLFHPESVIFLPIVPVAVFMRHRPRISGKVLSYLFLGFTSILTIVTIISEHSLVSTLIPNTVQFAGLEYIRFIITTYALLWILGMAAAIVGRYDASRRQGLMFLFGAFTVALVALQVYAFTSFFPRYIFPLFPILVIIASYSSVMLVRWIRARNVICAYVVATLLTASAIHYLIFIPQTHYDLENGSPQPSFSAIYGVIRSSFRDGDLIISRHPTLSQLFIGDPGMRFSSAINGYLVGRHESQANINGYDRYTGAPFIPDLDSLIQTIERNHGFIITNDINPRDTGLIHDIAKDSDTDITLIGTWPNSEKQTLHLFRF